MRVRLMKASLVFAKGPSLEDTLKAFEKAMPRGIVFDLSAIPKLSHSALGILVDAVMRLERRRPFEPHPTAIAVCGFSQKMLTWIKAKDLDRVIPIFKNFAEVLSDARFKSLCLQGVPSVVLCANRGARLSPLTDEKPAALLDFLGKPLAQRVVDHAGVYGLQEFVLNPGFQQHQIADFAQMQPSASVFCAYENAWNFGRANDVATLLRLNAAHGCFLRDTFVFQSHVLSNVDLGAMMDFHRKKGADATLAVSPNALRSACDAEGRALDDTASAILLSPNAVAEIGARTVGLGATELVPALRAAQLDVQLHISGHESASIQCGKDYFACQSAVLSDNAFGIVPHAEQIEQNVWVSEAAKLDRRVDFKGACFVGANARLEQGSLLQGASVVNSGCVVEKHAVLSNSILMPNTHVAANTLVDHMIAAPTWAVNHAFANGSLQNRAPLDGLAPLQTALKADVVSPTLRAKMA